MATLTPALLAKPALAAELRSNRASARAPAAKVVTASAEQKAEVVSRRSTLSLAAVRGRARAPPAGVTPGRAARPAGGPHRVARARKTAAAPHARPAFARGL
jgi:hypothetical protein